MSTKINKELIRQMIKERNEIGEDTAKLRSWCEKYCARGFIHHLTPPRDLNWEQNLEYLSTVIVALDWKKTIDDMIAEGDKVVIRHTIEVTQKGTFAGIPATGKHGSIQGSDIYRIEGKQILEWWEFNDMLGGMTQLGAVISLPPNA
jgi:hypothetical protein